jgi:hypothetical protein
MNEYKSKTCKLKTKKCFLHLVNGNNYHFDSGPKLGFF